MTSCLYAKKLVSYTYHICIHTFLKDLIWFDKMLVVCENEHVFEHIVSLLLDYYSSGLSLLQVRPSWIIRLEYVVLEYQNK